MSEYGTLDDVVDVTSIQDQAREFQTQPVKEAKQRLPVAGPMKLGQELYKVFDLEAYRVRRLVIECEVNKVPTVTITRLVTVEEAERIGKLEPIE